MRVIGSKVQEVYVFDRNSRRLLKEKPYPRFTHLLWQKQCGLALAELFLKYPWASRYSGAWHNCRYSRIHISHFVKHHNIHLEELEKSLDQFTSFNDFFIRKFKPHARPINKKSHVLISPADCRMFTYPITRNTVIPVKSHKIHINKLLHSPTLSRKFDGGTCIVCRLAISDYHRFCYVDGCKHAQVKTINGFYRAVHPFSLRKMKDVFCENQRQLTLLHTKNFGCVAHVDVGALFVGKIQQHFPQGTPANKGQEKGVFEFGGSTIILLLQPHAVRMDADVMQNTQRGVETRILYGERIGTACSA